MGGDGILADAMSKQKIILVSDNQAIISIDLFSFQQAHGHAIRFDNAGQVGCRLAGLSTRRRSIFSIGFFI